MLSHVATKMFHIKTPRGPRCARQARQRTHVRLTGLTRQRQIILLDVAPDPCGAAASRRVAVDENLAAKQPRAQLRSCGRPG